MRIKFIQPLILVIVSILFFMKWVVPNYPNLDTNSVNQLGGTIGNYVNLLMSEINVTGFNPSTEQIFDFSFFSEKFSLSGPLFFTLNVILILTILIRDLNLLKKIELLKFSSIIILSLNLILIYYPIYLIFWVNNTISKVNNFYKNSNLGLTNDTTTFNHVMKINYIVYIVIVLYFIVLVIEIMKSKDKLFKR